MLKFAFQNLMSRPARSLLSLLGLTVAIVGMVGLFSVAHGIDQMVSSTFGQIPGLLVMQPGAPIPLFSRIPSDWGEEIGELEGVNVVNPEVWLRANLIEGKTIISPPRFVMGTDIPSRLELRQGIYREDIVAGRFLKQQDQGTNHAVISQPIAEEFDKEVEDTLRVNGNDMKIVGIYHSGALMLDVTIIVDIEYARSISRFDPETVSSFYVEPMEEVDHDRLVQDIREHFRGRSLEPWQPSAGLSGEMPLTGNPIIDFLVFLYREISSRFPGLTGGDSLAPASSDESGTEGSGERFDLSSEKKSPGADATDSPFETGDEEKGLPVEVRTAVDWAERFDDFSKDLNIVLTILTGIGVTIAVLSIVNTMLMSVTERIIEFGILKANGWSSTDILKLITFESATLGLAGGLLGSALGWAATLVLNYQWSDRIYLYASPGLLLFSVGFSTLLGILGGLYPAVWAMRMMPMDAIRRG